MYCALNTLPAEHWRSWGRLSREMGTPPPGVRICVVKPRPGGRVCEALWFIVLSKVMELEATAPPIS